MRPSPFPLSRSLWPSQRPTLAGCPLSQPLSELAQPVFAWTRSPLASQTCPVLSA